MEQLVHQQQWSITTSLFIPVSEQQSHISPVQAVTAHISTGRNTHTSQLRTSSPS
jgi:hypothetical protein